MDFSEALLRLKAGDRVRRTGWNGQGMWIALQVPDAGSKMGHPYVYLKDTRGLYGPWTPSQVDTLACDWEVTND